MYPGFSYKSCWTDKGDTRSLTGAEYRSDDMTVESCVTFCEDFGVEHSRECYCSDKLGGMPHPRTTAVGSVWVMRRSGVVPPTASTSTSPTLP